MARDLYKLGRGRDIPNVVAFDPYAAQEILSTIGPVTVEDSPDPITAENVFAYLRSEHDNQMGAPDRKAYIGRLAKAMIAKIETQPGDLDLWKLIAALRRTLSERHLLVSIQEPGAAAIFARHGWDGAVRPGQADFLMVIDTNMGYNKVNLHIKEEISYTVDLSEPSAPVAMLTVRHIHTLAEQKPCVQWTDAEASTYANWMARCYYVYLRALIPAGSQLLDAKTQPVPDAWMDSGRGDDGTMKQGKGDADTSELSTFQVIPFGERRDTVFRYRLPTGVLTRDEQGWHYRLRVQKQPGTSAIPFVVELRDYQGRPPSSPPRPRQRRPAVRCASQGIWRRTGRSRLPFSSDDWCSDRLWSTRRYSCQEGLGRWNSNVT
jgi:hypothetical protein